MVKEKNYVKTFGLFFYALGIFSMHAFMTVNFWLIVLGVVPSMTLFGVVSASSLWGIVAWGLGPPIGAVLMVIGGLVYSRQNREVVK